MRRRDFWRAVKEEPESAVTPEPQLKAFAALKAAAAKNHESKPGMLQEVFNLDEGPVTLTFPEVLSEDSYEDLASYFELFLRKAKRRTTIKGVEARGITGPDKEAAN